MDASLLISLTTVACVALFVLGSPMLIVMGLWVVAAHLAYGFPLQNIGSSMFEGLNSFALLAAPLFILTGDLIGGGGIARRIITFTLSALSWLRGGLGMASIVASGFFAAISGSNAATTATIGSISALSADRFLARFWFVSKRGSLGHSGCPSTSESRLNRLSLGAAMTRCPSEQAYA